MVTLLMDAGRNKFNIKQGLFLCDCGKEFTNTYDAIRAGRVKSCGCLKSKVTAQRNKDTAKSGKEANTYKHGFSNKPFWNTWSGLRQRCDNPKNHAYASYGGRGITYDPRWQEFENFYADMFDTWEKGLSIDRIDNNGNYCKENCRWVNAKTQATNKRNNLKIDGKILDIVAEETGIPLTTLRSRKNQNVAEDKILKVHRSQLPSVQITYNGQTKHYTEWAKELGVDPNTLRRRKKDGWSDKDVIEKPHREDLYLVQKDGETKCLKIWSKELGVDFRTMKARFYRAKEKGKDLATILY
jgi:hypothetical protein